MGSLKFQRSHTLTRTHTHTQRPLVKHWIACRKWLFGNLEAPPMAHRALSLLSPPISPFLSFPLLLLLPSRCFSLQFPSPSLVRDRGCLPTLSSCPSLPQTCQQTASTGDCSAWNGGFKAMRLGFMWAGKAAFSGAGTRKSPCLRIQNAAKLGKSPSLRSSCFLRQHCRISVLSQKSTGISLVLFTNSACFFLPNSLFFFQWIN